MQWKWSSMSAAARDHPIPTTGREFLEPSRLGEPALDYALGELGAAFNQQTLEAFSDGAAIVDLSRPDLPLVYINTAFQRITGYTASEVLGQNCRFLQGTDDSQPEIFQLSKAIKARQDLITVLRNYRKDGTIFWNELRVRPLFNSEGEATHYLGVIRDVTAYRELNDRLERSACFDELTGLLTRSAFLARLAEIPGEIGLVVICCDTDQLRDVNGTHGRGTGDAVLQELGRRLQSAPDMVLASRLAAGQFAVALRVPEGSDGAAAIPHFQANALRPFAVLGATVLLTITVGWTRSTAGVLPNEGLLIQAETALYEAKAAGRGEIRAFNPATERESRRRLRITEDLRSALQHQEFVLHYQPKVDLLSGRIIGLEALLRWQHPAFGLQPPDRFMSVAEDSGLIVEIGAWVLTEACRFAVHLNRAGHAVYVAANVSPVQFQRDDVVALMRRVLKESGAEPGWIALELTETVIAGSNPLARLPVSQSCSGWE